MSTFVRPRYGILSGARRSYQQHSLPELSVSKSSPGLGFLCYLLPWYFQLTFQFPFLNSPSSKHYLLTSFLYIATLILLYETMHMVMLFSMQIFQHDTSGRSQWPWSIRRGSLALDCWDRRFVSRRWHGCLSLGLFACWLVSSCATGWSLVCVCVNLETSRTRRLWARHGPLCSPKKYKVQFSMSKYLSKHIPSLPFLHGSCFFNVSSWYFVFFIYPIKEEL